MTKAVPAPTRMSCDDPPTNDQVSEARQAELNAALQKYLDLMYDCDTSRFDQVFRPTAQLHGFRDREMQVWPMDVYRDMPDRRQSPKIPECPARGSNPLCGLCLSDHGVHQSAGADRGLGVCRLPDLAL